MRNELLRNMENENTGWGIARARAKAKFARKMKLGKYWKQRWKTDREGMLANLGRVNQRKKDRADQRTKKLSDFISSFPPRVKSWELRPLMVKRFAELFNAEMDSKYIQRTIMNLRNRKMIVFDEAACEWIIKPVAY